MPACPPLRQLEELLNDELPQVRCASLYAHIEVCQLCQESLEQIAGGQRALVGDVFDRTTRVANNQSIEQFLERLRDNPLGGFSPGADSAWIEDDDAVRFPQSPTDAAPLGRVDDYDIVQRVGSGATGVLFKAVERGLRRTVALKVLRGEWAARQRSRWRLEHEAKVLARLKHEHIVPVYKTGRHRSFPPYIVTKFIEGSSLQSMLLKENGKLVPQEAARLVHQVACALTVAHKQNLLHGDIKPTNILIDRESGRAMVTDFGLARVTKGANQYRANEKKDRSHAYASPEQIRSENRVDGRSDVYSLGIVLYKLLTGETPDLVSKPKSLPEVFRGIPRPPRKLNNAVSRDLDSICLNAIAKEPKLRYQSAASLADDMQRLLHNQPVSARPITAVIQFWRCCRQFLDANCCET